MTRWLLLAVHQQGRSLQLAHPDLGADLDAAFDVPVFKTEHSSRDISERFELDSASGEELPSLADAGNTTHAPTAIHRTNLRDPKRMRAPPADFLYSR